MASAVSSEKPKAQIVHEVARDAAPGADEGRLTIAVVGPAVVHTGAAHDLARLVEMGHVGVVFGGNAVATHDIEAALFGTSLGISMEEGTPIARRPASTTCAPSTPVRRCGGIAAAVEQGVLSGGLMYTLRQDRHAVRAGRQHPRRRAYARSHPGRP